MARRAGRVLDVTVYYNRSFTLGRGSWPRQMRPDVSLQIIPRDSREHEVWVHFDVKYRLDQIERVFTDEDEVREIEGSAKNEDLKKMHTYRDAIRRTAGAYVIYPGDRVDAMEQYNEILPGLGAFPLCPTSGAEPSGASTFLIGHHGARFEPIVAARARSLLDPGVVWQVECC